MWSSKNGNIGFKKPLPKAEVFELHTLLKMKSVIYEDDICEFRLLCGNGIEH
jgi:hypothetical protein